MAGTNVLVTGGCGRIGKELVNRLVADGDRVTVIDLKHGDVKGVHYITTQIHDIKSLDDIQIVYHLAASIDYKASKRELEKRNVAPAAILLELCKKCEQFIFMSTTSVYSESKEPIAEDSSAKPYTNYGWSKLECEGLIQKRGIPYTILRSSQVYGPDFEEGYAAVLKKLQKGEMRIFGNGDNHIPLVHVNDLIDALVLVKGNKKALNQVFNVDGGYGKTQMDFMETAAMLLKVEPPKTKINPMMAKLVGRITGRGDKVNEYIDKLTKNRQISIGKIQKLGYTPKVTLKMGIREVIEAFRQHGILD